jgi:hypothetical protein
LSAIFLYLVVNAIVSIGYRIWCHRRYGTLMAPQPAA